MRASPVSEYGRLRLVREVLTEPPLGLGERHALPLRVVGDLVATHPPDREVARLRVAEVETADARTRCRRVRLGEPDARLVCGEQPEQGALLGVVRTGGIPER